MSLVVTSDNRQASNTSAELAREKLRQDLTEAVQRNRDSIQTNKEHIAVLEEKIKRLERAR
jgi:predicted alpha/beta-fold hydrolase